MVAASSITDNMYFHDIIQQKTVPRLKTIAIKTLIEATATVSKKYNNCSSRNSCKNNNNWNNCESCKQHRGHCNSCKQIQFLKIHWDPAMFEEYTPLTGLVEQSLTYTKHITSGLWLSKKEGTNHEVIIRKIIPVIYMKH